MNDLRKKGNGLALLPFLIFIVIYLGAGLILQAQGMEMAFYQFPSVTAMFIAVIAAFCMGKETLDEKFSIFARGAANENVLTMLMIYILQVPSPPWPRPWAAWMLPSIWVCPSSPCSY